MSHAFDSGSTGADGAFAPSVNTQLQLPPSGVFNFTTVNIPTGVAVTFKKNTTNTPVVMLASGDVTIAGTLAVSGSASPAVGASGDGNIGDDGQPGLSGPGGYDGGRGGLVGANRRGGNGVGPGAGQGGASSNCNEPAGGGGGGFGATGANTRSIDVGCSVPAGDGRGGASYGSSLLLPLIGGSGGGGGASGASFQGSGGGGGGGAILIASSTAITVSGSLRADGGTSGGSSGGGSGGTGGGGSGGAIRLIATVITGNGTISAAGGAPGGAASHSYANGGSGAVGRIRFESNTFTRTAASNPVHTFGAPSTVFVAGLPSLRISKVAGVDAPTAPTGNADITLPASTANPVTVEFATTGVPVGNIVSLTVSPANAAAITAVSPALTGSTDSASASVSVDIPPGPSTLLASTTYTIVASLGDALSRFAQGERVEKIRLGAALNGPSTLTLITVSGKTFEVPQAALAVGG